MANFALSSTVHDDEDKTKYDEDQDSSCFGEIIVHHNEFQLPPSPKTPSKRRLLASCVLQDAVAAVGEPPLFALPLHQQPSQRSMASTRCSNSTVTITNRRSFLQRQQGRRSLLSNTDDDSITTRLTATLSQRSLYTQNSTSSRRGSIELHVRRHSHQQRQHSISSISFPLQEEKDSTTGNRARYKDRHSLGQRRKSTSAASPSKKSNKSRTTKTKKIQPLPAPPSQPQRRQQPSSPRAKNKAKSKSKPKSSKNRLAASWPSLNHDMSPSKTASARSLSSSRTTADTSNTSAIHVHDSPRNTTASSCCSCASSYQADVESCTVDAIHSSMTMAHLKLMNGKKLPNWLRRRYQRGGCTVPFGLLA